ncbi:hypothetical protein [Streptomyces pratensis]|uniref:hypothetical protein n=1 Tax=Streptomyces pratensis TaxID=1169025 RepID=UPI003638030B
MLHTAVTNTGNDLRDALGKSVEKLEASGQAAQQDTTRAVVDELGRMRANLREVRDRLSAGGEMLNTEVRQAVTELRTEMRDVRAAIESNTPPAPAPKTAPVLAHEAIAGNTSGPETSGSFARSPERAAMATAGEHNEVPAKPALALPAQRDGNDWDPPATGLSVGTVQQAVRDVLAEELAPLSAVLTQKTDEQNGWVTTMRDDVRAHLREAVVELCGHVEAARQEANAELTALRRETIDLRAEMEQLRLQSTGNEAESVEVTAEHSELLRQAARVSSVDLLCHRDIWEFITAQAGRHQHFRVPPQVAAEGEERIRAAVSGRSLIALLISLNAIKDTAQDGDGDQELAATLYERIQDRLASLAAHGQPVTITLDDRSSPTDPAPPAEATASGTIDEPAAGS